MCNKITVPTTPVEMFQLIQKNKSYLDKHSSKKHQSTLVVDNEIQERINLLSVTEEEVISVLGRKWKSTLAVIGGFIAKYQYITSDKDVSLLPIASTSDFMINLTGSDRNARNLISKMVSLKLLTKGTQTIEVEKLLLNDDGSLKSKELEKKEVESSYVRGLCSVYYYSKNIQNILKDIINKYNIVIKQVVVVNTLLHTTKVETFENDLFDKVKFSSKLSIPCTKANMEEDIVSILYKKYPQLETYQKLADKMNESLNAANQISFKPNIQYDRSHKYIKKIGIRATNSLVSAKKEVTDNPKFKGKYKEDVLKEQLGETWYEFDVKSSVPRVNILLNTGIWTNNDTDIYKLMYNRMNTLLHTTKVETFDEEVRKDFKSMFMRGYFDRKTAMVAHVMPALIGENNETNIGLFDDFKEEMKRQADTFFTAYSQAIEDVIGKRYDSEIFFHESCIYLEVVKKIRLLGINCVQIYDGFYTSEPVEDIENIIKCTAEEYYKKYILTNNNDTYLHTTKVQTFESLENLLICNVEGVTMDYLDLLDFDQSDVLEMLG